ncbi:solute carrier family 2, facilitated glucose transporter member 3 isoform X5 [Phycodurus eques]|uniref:solute carrier family 2, facilitated glucose transporter member 3 isoform X5 n=1 Tax=Phycodurus eques TaxID=693459 RepID=UPI002ACDA52C|nr:solute carrier family 2, facilitated glucose transporter member 3 isoform X5 [Phycodurus eques]
MAVQECPQSALLLTSVMAAILGSLQVGYHTGNINAPAKIIEEFFNQTWRDRYNETMSEQSLTLLWSLSVSIKDFGALLGCLGVKYVADSFGRRNSILIVNCLSVVGTGLMVVSKVSESFETLILGRLLFGLFCGLVMSLNPLYIQEVSPTVLRGAFATLNQVAYASGILLGMVSGLETILGTEELWSIMLSLSLIPALAQYLILPFCPESPRYLLINKGQEAKADAALLRLRGSPGGVSAELEEMKGEAARTQAAVGVLEFFQKRSYRQPIIIVLCVSMGSQLSGFNASTVPELASLQVLLAFCLVSAYEFGPGPISWFIAGELFDQPGRSIAMAYASILNWGGKFLLALLFPPILVSLQSTSSWTHFLSYLPLSRSFSLFVFFLHAESHRRLLLPPLHGHGSDGLHLYLVSSSRDQGPHVRRDRGGVPGVGKPPVAE